MTHQCLHRYFPRQFLQYTSLHRKCYFSTAPNISRRSAHIDSRNQSTKLSKFEPRPSRFSRNQPQLPLTGSHFPSAAPLTKIICTLGPASDTEEVLTDMIHQGMSVARLNFSHGTHEEHQKRFALVRRVAAKLKKPVAIMCDIQGPKIRIGKMLAAVQLNTGDTIRVTTADVLGTKERISIGIPMLLQDLGVGDQIFINDGIVELDVVAKEPHDLVCIVKSPGVISSAKGCNIPNTKVQVEIMTDKDRQDLQLIARLNPEYVAASFVGSARDIQTIRTVLREHQSEQVQVIAKMERPLALQNMDEIIRAADGVMVARGDLGVEIPAHQVPMAQKNIVSKCNAHARPVIIATQMLDSMTAQPRPTRAEASDVFNAVLDGADAVMLSGETSVGRYPVETVRCMAQIVHSAQKSMPERNLRSYFSVHQHLTETIGSSIFHLAREFEEIAVHGKIVILTDSGFAARMVSKFRPSMPICAVVTTERVSRELALVWGVSTVSHTRLTHLFRKQAYEALLKMLCEMELVSRKEIVILVHTMHHSVTLSVVDVKEALQPLSGEPGTFSK